MDIESYQKYLIGTYVVQDENLINSFRAALLPKKKVEKIKKEFFTSQQRIKERFVKTISKVNAEYLARQQLEQGSNNG